MRRLSAPRLAGQKPEYLRHQIKAFQKGWRGADVQDVQGKLMADAIAPLEQARIDAALAYLDSATLQLQPDLSVRGDVERGGYLYERNCAVCHGEAGEGSKLEATVPRLNIQHMWYLERQLNHFRTRLRGFHPDDSLGNSMGFYAKLLPDDKAVGDVLAWLAKTAHPKGR